jgi:hypothetical protein
MAEQKKRRQTDVERREEELRDMAQAAAREAQELDRQEVGRYEEEQARGHHHETQVFEPHEQQALDDAARREESPDDAGVDQTKHPASRRSDRASRPRTR